VDACIAKMRIVIDGDSSPSIDIIEKFAKKNKLEMIIFCDFSHNIDSEYSKIIKVDSLYQNVDMKISNFAKEKDVVITNDYGLALLCLLKKCFVISFYGIEYTKDNIDTLLEKRYINLKSKHKKGPKKRTKKDDLNLLECLNRIGGRI